MGCPASSLVIASVGVVRVRSRGGSGVVFAFRWSLFNRGGAWFEMVGVVVGSVFVAPTSAWILRLYVGFYSVMSASGGAAMDAGADPRVTELEEISWMLSRVCEARHRLVCS